MGAPANTSQIHKDTFGWTSAQKGHMIRATTIKFQDAIWKVESLQY